MIDEYEQNRRKNLDTIRSFGASGYDMIPNFGARSGVQPLSYAKNHCKQQTFTPDVPQATPDDGPQVTVAGRVMLNRSSGGLVFIVIRDVKDDMQMAVSKKRVSELAWNITKSIDLGDIILVAGRCANSKTNEPTVWAEDIKIISKSLLPPPAKMIGLIDTELRYRKRYLDLYSNREVMNVFVERARIIRSIREYLHIRDFLEVETPMMQPISGGATAKPFVTHHNALDMQLYLRIAPELYLKRLLVGGLEKVYEINRNFRNEGISTKHNPEFTMLEAYKAYANYEDMMMLVESMITSFSPGEVEHKSSTGVVTKINLERPWRRVTLVEIVREVTGWQFGEPLSDELISQLSTRLGDATITELTRGRLLVLIYEKIVEHTLINPTFVTHFPVEIMPLAKASKEHHGFAEVFELAMNGMEIAPGYTELTNPDEQLYNMQKQGGEIDIDFITALKHGMPPAGGVGIGIDRLVMVLTGQESIRDVVLFPLMKPTNADNTVP